MSPPDGGRVGALIDRPVRDRDGVLLGRVADLVTEADARGRERVVALMVAGGAWGRLLGYERPDRTGPPLLDRLARLVLRRSVHRVAWQDATVDEESGAVTLRWPVDHPQWM